MKHHFRENQNNAEITAQPLIEMIILTYHASKIATDWDIDRGDSDSSNRIDRTTSTDPKHRN
ncbi:Uncharacterised protein [BD1-7 clade bacterium]|uniref:Uncharacterized protein n=1 Tax=BD1-7 clade bacterium TaxID=2029982 RepID=A0A5S9QY96_9GAMM|nr:Uncharacterised protein [BD1-7 clade bacterium]